MTELKVFKKLDGKLSVNFPNDQLFHNLLVVVTDSLGQTVFLENLYRFKGPYIKVIDLPNNGQGTFNIQVHRDEERIIRNITH